MRYILLVLSICLFCAHANAATYYVCNNSSTCGSGWSTGSDSNSLVQAQSKTTPWASLSRAYSLMTAGDTLVIGNGTYTGASNKTIDSQKPPTSSSVWTTIKAENIGGVTIDGQSSNDMFYLVNTVNYHWIYNGIVWANAGGNNVVVQNASYIKFLNCGAVEAAAGNNVNWNIADGSSYILLENCYAWGMGRYQYIAHLANYIIFRNCVGRKDSVNDSSNPTAVFSIYSSSNCLVQNCVAIDSDQLSSYTASWSDGAACYMVPTTSGNSDNVTFKNSICLNSAIGGLFVAANNPANNIVFDNMALWGANKTVAVRNNYLRGVNDSLTHITSGSSTTNQYFVYESNSATVYNSVFVNITGSGTSVFGGGITYGYNDYYGNTGTPSLASHDITSNPIWSIGNLSGGLKYLTRIESGSNLSGKGQSGTDIGANILTQWGTSGTLYGETGYNSDSGVPLWPYPNEDIIKSKMSAYSANGVSGARGFCTGTSIDGSSQTLTKYIWEYMGNQIPSGIYSGGDSTPPTVTAFSIPSTYTSLTVPVSSFTASDNVAVTSYCVTAANISSGCSWASSPQSSVTFSSPGSQTAYAWAKDAAGNISAPATSTTTITIPPGSVSVTKATHKCSWR